MHDRDDGLLKVDAEARSAGDIRRLGTASSEPSLDILAYEPNCSTKSGAGKFAAAGEFVDGGFGKAEDFGDFGGGHDVVAGEAAAGWLAGGGVGRHRVGPLSC
jgi:hypothetical protein